MESTKSESAASRQKETTTMLVLGRLQDLERRINSKTLGRIRDLTVESTGDSIVLSGTTSTYYAKQLATQIVLDEFGEFILDNDISVA